MSLVWILVWTQTPTENPVGFSKYFTLTVGGTLCWLPKRLTSLALNNPVDSFWLWVVLTVCLHTGVGGTPWRYRLLFWSGFPRAPQGSQASVRSLRRHCPPPQGFLLGWLVDCPFQLHTCSAAAPRLGGMWLPVAEELRLKAVGKNWAEYCLNRNSWTALYPDVAKLLLKLWLCKSVCVCVCVCVCLHTCTFLWAPLDKAVP